MDYTLTLPNEILCMLLDHNFSSCELCELRLVSRRFNALIVTTLLSRCRNLLVTLIRTSPTNKVQLNVLQHLQKRLSHVSNFYFAGTLLDFANQLITEKLSRLSDATNAYQLYHLIQPFEVLYFRAAVSKICTRHTIIEE